MGKSLNKKSGQLILKKTLDITVALTLLTILSPIFILCYACIVILDGAPAFFTQDRPGLNGQIFKIYKFRTMRTPRTGDEPDHQRTTYVGQFLRKSSLDELPQLINVLMGDLSLVGPRPLLVEYLPLYNAKQKKRHDVKPGITGWAQINGRNSITWEQKFNFDIWYVENWSFALDIKILFMTAFKLFNRKNVNASELVTMEKFKGSKND